MPINYYDIPIYAKAGKKRSTHRIPGREDGPSAERRSREKVAKVASEPGL